MKNPRNRIVTAILALAFLALVIVALLTFNPVSAHMIGGTHTPTQNCHYLIGGTSHQACIHQPTVHPLSFTQRGSGYWATGLVVPAGKWTFRYLCTTLGASPIDEYDILVEYGLLARHVPLICNGQFHSEPYTFHYQHTVWIATSRPVFASITF